MHCEPKHLSLREIKLARYLISTYSGTRTVEVHSVTHADPAYSRSNAGQRLQHTLAYNPHRCLLRCTYVCMCVCVCDREREREKERKGKGKERAQGSLGVCRQQWSGCFVTVLGRAQEMHHDAASHSWISSTIRIDFFFFLRGLTVHPYSTIMHLPRSDQ